MMYLQIMYQHGALQMSKMIKQKGFNWRVNYSEIWPHKKFTLIIFPMKYEICTDKLPAAATVHFPGAK